MPEPTTNCIDCGISIMQRTANRLQGRCVHCSHKAKAIPPHGFQLPDDLATRITSLNENHEYYRHMAWQHDTDFVHAFLNKEEERRRLYHQWLPRLQAFAEQCRIDQQLPNDDLLSNEERGQQQIYQKLFTHDPPQSGHERNAVLYTMPTIAMLVAHRLWPHLNHHTIILTLAETERWNNIYTPPEDCWEWYSHYTWDIDTAPAQRIELFNDHNTNQWESEDFPDNEQPWLVSASQYHGPLAAAGHTELWSWNGSQARFIKDVSSWVS